MRYNNMSGLKVRSWIPFIRGFKKGLLPSIHTGRFPCTNKFSYKSAGFRYTYARTGSQYELAAYPLLGGYGGYGGYSSIG